MLTYTNMIVYETNKLIDAEIDRITQILLLGNADDYSDYKHLIGTVNGLKSAKELLEAAESIVEGADRS